MQQNHTQSQEFLVPNVTKWRPYGTKNNPSVLLLACAPAQVKVTPWETSQRAKWAGLRVILAGTSVRVWPHFACVAAHASLLVDYDAKLGTLSFTLWHLVFVLFWSAQTLAEYAVSRTSIVYPVFQLTSDNTCTLLGCKSVWCTSATSLPLSSW